MKKLITKSILIMGIFSYISVSSQVKKKMCDELMQNSYIFEGKVIASKQKIRMKGIDNKYYNYNSYLVEINKVVRGNIKIGTVEILGEIYGIGFEDTGKISEYVSTDGPKYDNIPPSEGIYFCYKEVPIKDTSVANTNSKSLEYYCGDSMANGELKKDNNDNLIGYFPTIAEFYAYINANYGVKIQ